MAELGACILLAFGTFVIFFSAVTLAEKDFMYKYIGKCKEGNFVYSRITKHKVAVINKIIKNRLGRIIAIEIKYLSNGLNETFLVKSFYDMFFVLRS
jgi:hypothetical protein